VGGCLAVIGKSVQSKKIRNGMKNIIETKTKPAIHLQPGRDSLALRNETSKKVVFYKVVKVDVSEEDSHMVNPVRVTIATPTALDKSATEVVGYHVKENVEVKV
jgi:hypothetical protein